MPSFSKNPQPHAHWKSATLRDVLEREIVYDPACLGHWNRSEWKKNWIGRANSNEKTLHDREVPTISGAL